MASLKDVKYRLTAIQKTKQITRAMNMVACAKLRSAQRSIEQFRPYLKKYNEVLNLSLAQSISIRHPLLNRQNSNVVCIIFIAPDKGLCGGFVINLINKTKELVHTLQEEGKEYVFYCLGKKSTEFIRKMGYPIQKSIVECMSSVSYTLAIEVMNDIQEAFLKSTFSEVYCVYGEFKSLMQQLPSYEVILPFQPKEIEEDSVKDIVFSPPVNILLEDLIPNLIRIQIYKNILSTVASEHAARMIAMDNATGNCTDMIKSLSRLYNKVRQASVTSELMDIVGGAEALNG
ncbi:MAG: ATP synthase F1 subunit gamma [Desulfovibrionaceae bacterium]